jgi:hypothetical protein
MCIKALKRKTSSNSKIIQHMLTCSWNFFFLVDCSLVILLVSQPIVLCVLICGVVRSLLVQWFGVGMNVDLVRVSFGAAFFSPVEFVCDRV